MFVFLNVRFLAFQTQIAPPYKARDRSGDVKVVFTVIEINLLFSRRSFIDNDVGLLGRQFNDLVVVNHCLEFVELRYPTETLVDTALLMLVERVHLAEMNFMHSGSFSLSNISHYSATFTLVIMMTKDWKKTFCYPHFLTSSSPSNSILTSSPISWNGAQYFISE